MSAVKSAKSATGLRVMPVRELLTIHMERHGVKNIELAQKLGYSAPNVIAMLRAGTMKLPMNKIAVTAQALHIDPLYLANCVNAENGFHLEDLIDAISKRTAITLNEEKLIQALRAASGGADLDLDEYPQARDQIVSIFVTAAKAQIDDDAGLVRAIKNKPRNALLNPTSENLRLAK
jgi:hypothetical protein